MTQTQKALEKANKIHLEVSEPFDRLLKAPEIQKRFQEVLGAKAAQFVSSVIAAVNSNADLKVADPRTILASAMVAASLDLPINPSLSFAHLVPYAGKCQFQMGWRGFIQLGLRTNQYKTINAAIVLEGELVSSNKFTGEMVFDETKKTSDKIIGYVSYFKLLNGFEKYFYMTLEQMKIHGKRYSKSYSNEKSRWQQDFDSMALKTVIKLNLSKWGILSVELQKAFKFDQAVIKDVEAEIVEYPDAPDAALTTTSSSSSGDLSQEEKDQILKKEAEEAQKELDKKKAALKEKK